MEQKVRARSLIAGVLFTILFLSLIGRLYWVQVVEAAELQKGAAKYREDREVLVAERGSILDRNNKTLAEESVAYTIAVNPQIISQRKNQQDIAHGLALILRTNETDSEMAALEEKILQDATKRRPDGAGFLIEVEIRSEGLKVDGDKKILIDQLIATLQNKASLEANQKVTDVGIILKEEQKRYYPNNTLASHVLGYTDREGKPVGGIESAFNNFLAGKDGELNHQTDRKGIELPDTKAIVIPAINGKNVRLTIDQNIQYYTETALKKAYDKYHPKSMIAVAVDPKTMEILAMANAPDFNPNRYWEADQNSFINRAVASQYEPGSTFKIVTLAGAIEEGIFNPNELYQSGTINVLGRTLHDHNDVGWGKISFMDGLLLSSNVAFVKLGYERLKGDRLKDYIQRFGFGTKTGISLPNEVSGSGGDAFKYEVDYATATYGQGKITTTAIQQIAAYAAIANGGQLLKPQIIKDITDPATGEVIQSFAPEVIRRVVSEETAKQTALDLEQVVVAPLGTGKKYAVDGYRVAGKTGTANFVENGEYAVGKWNISFIGFAPVEDPRIVIAVIAEDPDLKGDYHAGSEVTAPVFTEILSSSLSYMGVSTTANSKKTVELDDGAMVPDLAQATVANAKNSLSKANLKAETLGNGTTVLRQLPAPGTEVSLNQAVYLLTSESQESLLPNLSGKSVRDVVEICQFMNFSCKTTGEGYAISQAWSGEGDSRQLEVVFASIENTPIVDNKKAATPTPAKKTTGQTNKPTPTPVHTATSTKKPNPTPTPAKTGSR